MVVGVRPRTMRPVASRPEQEPEAREDAPGVGVHDEEGLARGVEGDRVGGLRADARHRQELPAQGFRTFRSHPFDLPAVLRAEEVEEGSEPPRLHAERPRGPQEGRKPRRRASIERLEREEAPPAQGSERALDVHPRRVLDQDRPDADLERRLARPPSGVTVAIPQAPVDAQKETARVDRLASGHGPATIAQRRRGAEGDREMGAQRYSLTPRFACRIMRGDVSRDTASFSARPPRGT